MTMILAASIFKNLKRRKKKNGSSPSQLVTSCFEKLNANDRSAGFDLSHRMERPSSMHMLHRSVNELPKTRERIVTIKKALPVR